jgi:hypothetical protein
VTIDAVAPGLELLGEVAGAALRVVGRGAQPGHLAPGG